MIISFLKFFNVDFALELQVDGGIEQALEKIDIIAIQGRIKELVSKNILKENEYEEQTVC